MINADASQLEGVGRRIVDNIHTTIEKNRTRATTIAAIGARKRSDDDNEWWHKKGFWSLRGVPYSNRDILTKLTSKISTGKNDSILVVQCVEWVPLLLLLGFTNIQLLLFVEEPDKVAPIIKNFNLIGVQCHVVELTLNWKITMNSKFKNVDLVIGNPPYQDPRSKTVKLWQEIIKAVISDIRPKEIAFVTPNAWFHEPEGRKIKSCITAMMTGSIVYADTTEDVKQYFPGIGEDIGYWIWENTPDKNGIVKTNIDGKVVDIDFKLSHSRPQLTNTDVLRSSIEKKLIDKIYPHSIRVEGLKGMQWEAGPKSVGLQETLSPIKTEEFSQSVRITPANTMYVQPHRVELKYGVCFTNSGYYYKAGKTDKYMPATNEPTGQNFLKIVCDSENESRNVFSFLQSKLYIVYVMHIIGKAFNDFALSRLPFLGRDKFWTDAELYNYFELTNEEIQYIESFQIK